MTESAPVLTASGRRAAVNVDIDSLELYYRIHGLDDAEAQDAVWMRGVPRFAKLFEDVGVRATFFVVAQDLETKPGASDQVRALVEAGHEIASHSHTHPYNLTRLDRDSIERELDEAREGIEAVTGQPVTGFRAPGYTITPQVLELLRDRGYSYDSSLFPCPPYYLAKAGVMGMMRLVGRRSRSILDRPSVMWARRTPHRRHGLLEFPVTVLPGLRFPLIGTSLLMMGEMGYSLIRPWVRSTTFVNLEFHGIDLCDLEEDGIDPVLRKQPDLRVPLEVKERLFRRVLEDLRDRWELDTLAEHAQALGPAL